ncbi:C2 family cysteine protease [Actinomadura rupiterrae]|uniref:C2 family cysteine protease n=1 Tax=Actinomadura rupiterrae TaxID=559627 RepID=UPI0020A2CDD2|nr:C2 family cysteine protease [Actinomadura rupiterrae]MCP2339915.1 hypothetical protein [Actinomadura rupiterrae]
MTEQQASAPVPRGRYRVRSGSYTIGIRRQDADSEVQVAEFVLGDAADCRVQVRIARAEGDWASASWTATIAQKDLPGLVEASAKEPDLATPGQDQLGGYFAPRSDVFKGAPHPSDITQGLVGDCRVASAFQAVAACAAGPELIQSLIASGEGVYEVTLVPTTGPKAMPASSARATALTISDFLPVTRHNRDPLYLLSGSPYGPSSQVPLWPAILEKAFATMWGGYAALDGAEERPVLAALGLGDFVHVNWMSDEETKPAAAKVRMLQMAKGGYAITTAARAKRHNYAVLAVDGDGVLVADPNTTRAGGAEKRWKSPATMKEAEKLPESTAFPLHFTWEAFFATFMWIYGALPPKK